MKMKDYLYYYFESEWDLPGHGALDDGYSCLMWRPSALKVAPNGLPLMTFGVWWVFHHLRVFANRRYGVFVIYKDGLAVHRSTVTPPYFRFPFMGRNDLQIGDTWTEEKFRGKGLASHSIRSIIQSNRSPGRRFWYVVGKDNEPSIRAARKAGFVKYGEGVRTKRFGLRALGSFEIISPDKSTVTHP
jgi:GNAT superfamily N-acetyltransferase